MVPIFAPSRAPHFPNFIYFLRTKHTCWNVARKSAKNWKVSSLSILCCLANERRGNYLENEDRYINKMARGTFIFFLEKVKRKWKGSLIFYFLINPSFVDEGECDYQAATSVFQTPTLH